MFQAHFCTLVLAVILLTSCGQVTPQTPQEKACQVKTAVQKIECFTKLAFENRSPDICDNIIDPGFRVVCKKNIAMETCDKDYCKSIYGNWKQDGCRADVQEKKADGEC